MSQALIISFAIGTLLFVAKLGSFYLLMKPFPRLKRWIHKKAIAQFILDILFGVVATHVISGGTLTGSMITTVFMAWSMFYIFCHVMYNKLEGVTYELKRKYIL